jgi:hypothetical protein
MSAMYNAMNEDLMFQEVHDRAAALRSARNSTRPAATAHRWWHPFAKQGARRAR